MKKAVIYARYSSDKQNEDSIEAQLRACTEYAAKHELMIVGTYTDEAISGKGSKTLLRKQYQKMLKDAEHGDFNVILIHKYDRVARNLGEHVNLDLKLGKLDVQLIAVAQEFGNGPEAKIMRALMWSMSEYYLDNLASETRKGARETALKGLHNGGYAPFGYDVRDQKYIINELEACYVRRMFAAAKSGEGFGKIIKELEALDIRGKRGKPIKYPQIYEILRNEKYTGVYIYSPVEEKKRDKRRSKPEAIRIEGALPAIISKELFKEVQEIMDARKHNGRRSDYMCSGLVYCACGAKMHATTTHRKNHEYRRFYCSAKCGRGGVSMDTVDEAALTYLKDLLNEENQEKIASAMRAYKGNETQRLADFERLVAQKIQEKQEQYDALLSNLSSGALPPEVLADIGRKMQALKEEIETLRNTEPPKDFTTEQIKSWLAAIKSSPTEAAVRLLVERIDISAEKETTAFNITSTLNAVVRIHGCGSALAIFPEILFLYRYKGVIS